MIMKTKNNSVTPIKRYYVLMRKPNKSRRYSNEAHFFVGKPQESIQKLEDAMNIYLNNQTEVPSADYMYKPIEKVVRSKYLHKIKRYSLPEEDVIYAFGTPSVKWITNKLFIKEEDPRIPQLSGINSCDQFHSSYKHSKDYDTQIVIEKPIVSWITNEITLNYMERTTDRFKIK